MPEPSPKPDERWDVVRKGTLPPPARPPKPATPKPSSASPKQPKGK